MNLSRCDAVALLQIFSLFVEVRYETIPRFDDALSAAGISGGLWWHAPWDLNPIPPTPSNDWQCCP